MAARYLTCEIRRALRYGVSATSLRQRRGDPASGWSHCSPGNPRESEISIGPSRRRRGAAPARRPAILPPALVLARVLAAAMVVAGCSSSPPSTNRPDPAPLRLDASVTQFRFDEGTRNLKAGVTNNGRRPIRVSQATI